MKSAIHVFLLASFLLISTGCGSMCVSNQDANFHAYGGVRDRQDLIHGRVASLFDPAAALPSVPVDEKPLPPEESRSSDDEEGGDSESMDDLMESDFRNNLLDELDKLDQLPEGLDSDGEDANADTDAIDVI